MPNLIDITGQRFGHWTVLRRAGSSARGEPLWLCRCDCETELARDGNSLRRGLSKSCGCTANEGRKAANKTHGESDRGGKQAASVEYRAWQSMKRRCGNPRDSGFAHYGGRGIAVCERWRDDFLAFLADVGRRPSPDHSLDRIDVNGNYEPGNVRWATRVVQMRNRRSTVLITVNGVTRCAKDWATALGGSTRLVVARIARGWSPEAAISEPIRAGRHAPRQP